MGIFTEICYIPSKIMYLHGRFVVLLELFECLYYLNIKFGIKQNQFLKIKHSSKIVKTCLYDSECLAQKKKTNTTLRIILNVHKLHRTVMCLLQL